MHPNRLYILLIAALVLIQQSAVAQNAEKPLKNNTVRYDRVTFGMGVGLDYGGIGANIIAYPGDPLGVFASIGYNLLDFGANFGLKARITSYKAPSVSPFILGMYGYYAALKLDGPGSRLSKSFNGFTVGFGFDTPVKVNKVGYWSFAVLVPLRGTTIDDYVKENRISLDKNLSPIGFSIGYKMIMSRSRS